MQLLPKILLTILLLSFLSGCQFIRIDRAAFTPSAPLIYSQKAEFVFTPQGRETFRLKDGPLAQQQQGFVRFCANTYRKTCRNKLPYVRYVGMRGYFDSLEPVKTDGKSYEYYPVILENGEKYFFLSLKNDGGKYGSHSPISALTFNSSFAARPFIEGAEINIVGEYKSFDQRYYLLSNEKVLPSNQLKHIRDISKNYPQRAEIANLLLDTVIEYNEDYESYLIQPILNENSADVRLILGLNHSSSWLRFKVSHLGGSLKTINGFTLRADDQKWRSPVLKFEASGDAKKVHESFEIQANKQEIAMVAALAKSSKATLQLHTAHRSIGRELKSNQKQQLLNMLKLNDLLGIKGS